MSGVKTIIALAFGLSAGLLLLILACALPGNWLPLILLIPFLLAPLPNLIFPRCCGGDDILSDTSSSSEIGYFVTSFLVVSGFGIIVVLGHANVIQPQAVTLSILSCFFVFGTMLGYTHYFGKEESF